MRDLEPDFWRNLREELAAGRQWVDRSVVLAYAALTGAVVVGFTLLAEAASHGFEQLSRRRSMSLIALGMVGFLAVTTQGPITAFIIVMEMISGHAMVLSLMACSLLASGVARLITRPMYLELAALLLPAIAAPPLEPAAPAAATDGKKS